MKITSFKRLGLKLALLAVLVLPELASAQVFNYNSSNGDVLAGFRKAPSIAGLYELVVDLGSVTNFLNVSAGQTITITNFTTTQLTNAFIDTSSSAPFANLQWSVFAACPASYPANWNSGAGAFPATTLWLTLPGTNVNTQTTPPSRQGHGAQQPIINLMSSVGGDAASPISSSLSASTNNTPTLVREPISANLAYDLTAFIGDPTLGLAIGDFGANSSPLPYTVENVAPSPFTTAMRSDFYQLCPTTKVDPFNQSTTATYFVGYFILNPNGTMTFTRASTAPPAPVAGSVTSSITNGLAPLQVIFTNTASSGGTNWVWSFGDGNSITNTTSGNVTNTYASVGTYTVTLTVNGAGGSSTNILTNYIVVTALPPVAGFTGAPTNGFAPLRVVFTNTSTGSITNWVWSFGNGTIITNLTGGNVTNTYASAGTNTVKLTVNGSGGSGTNTQVNYIVALPTPKLSTISLSGGKMVFSCSNSPAGVQYRILSTTNLTLPMTNWIPVVTNTFPNTYTNNSMTNAGAYFRLVSP